MRLPLLVSVPHAGLLVPPEARPYCALSPEEIRRDGDEQAREIYRLAESVREFVTSEIARAIVDLNRSADDRRADGVVKTHTCWSVPVYDPFPPESVVDRLLERYYHPYHERLRSLATHGVRLGVDCHTMAAAGPPVGPDPGKRRPAVCLSNGEGTCPDGWIQAMADAFRQSFGDDVRVNDPFTGGYITRSHSAELPWVQLELSRGDFATIEQKRQGVAAALQRFCRAVFE